MPSAQQMKTKSSERTRLEKRAEKLVTDHTGQKAEDAVEAVIDLVTQESRRAVRKALKDVDLAVRGYVGLAMARPADALILSRRILALSKTAGGKR